MSAECEGASRYFLFLLDRFHHLRRHFRRPATEVVAGVVAADAVGVEDAAVFGSSAVAADVVAVVAAGIVADWRTGRRCRPTA